jgi:hypothetical protein
VALLYFAARYPKCRGIFPVYTYRILFFFQKTQAFIPQHLRGIIFGYKSLCIKGSQTGKKNHFVLITYKKIYYGRQKKGASSHFLVVHKSACNILPIHVCPIFIF